MIATDERILSALRELSADLGYAPTVRELAEEVGIRSSATMHHRLKLLEDRGKVVRGAKGAPRALRLVT